MDIKEQRKVRISNDRLWEIAARGEDIDQWLLDHVGRGNWTELFTLTNAPYRCLSFKNEEDEIMFILRWL